MSNNFSFTILLCSFPAPAAFKLKKRHRRYIESQSPFSTDRSYNVPRGKGWQPKKPNHKPTQFVEFEHRNIDWKVGETFLTVVCHVILWKVGQTCPSIVCHVILWKVGQTCPSIVCHLLLWKVGQTCPSIVCHVILWKVGQTCPSIVCHVILWKVGQTCPSIVCHLLLWKVGQTCPSIVCHLLFAIHHICQPSQILRESPAFSIKFFKNPALTFLPKGTVIPPEFYDHIPPGNCT